MVDGLVYILENAVVRASLAGQIPQPLGTRHPAITPFQGFATGDGWIVIAIGNDALWATFCQAIDHPELLEDERFRTNGLRTANHGALEEILAPVMRARSTASWSATLDAHQLPFSPINNVRDVVQDPNVRYRGMIVEIDQPGIGAIEIAGSPFHLSETPGRVEAPAPMLGEHTVQVLRQVLGYSDERVQALLNANAVMGMDASIGLPAEDT